jgi:hypothetical protein
MIHVVLVAGALTAAAGCGNVVDSGADAAVDARGGGPVDGAPDAPSSVTRYAVGYVDNFTLTPDVLSISGFVAIVNTGTRPLNLSTASVTTFSDDNAAINWAFVKETGSSDMLDPGRAGGVLTQAAAAKVLTSNVVIEPIDDQLLNFTMGFATQLTAGVSLNAQAVISIDNVTATIPFRINVVSGPDVQFNSARRVSSQP